MAGAKTLTNPNGAFGQVNEDGQFCIALELAATTGTISAGQTVALVWDDTEKTMKAEAWDTDASGQNARGGRGVADEAITTTKVGRVVVFGFARVNVASGTAAEGSLATGSTTAGVATVTSPDATTVVGTVLGTFLGAKDGNNRAPVWVSPA